MGSNLIMCGVCDFRNINRSVVVWCPECAEGLCGECRGHHGASKSIRNHDTISITEYQNIPSNVSEIHVSQPCQKHKEHYQTYCKKHDCPCCRICVIETHNNCKDLTAIDDIVLNFESIGVESKSFEVDGYKNKQAVLISKCIGAIKLSNKMKINLKSSRGLSGCAILPKGKIMFCDYNKRRIIALKSDGSEEFEIVLDTNTFDMAYIEAQNTVAVTRCYSEKVIYIIDPYSKMVKRIIYANEDSYGITVNKNALVYCEKGKGIMEVQLYGQSKKPLVCLDMPPFSYVAVHGDNIYYTNKNNHSVTCYDIHGNLKWEFKDAQNLRYPQGIAVDNNGNVYVASMDTNSVVIITLDGKRCKTILSSRDGLSKPRAMHFEPTSNTLLVANETKFAFLFDVS